MVAIKLKQAKSCCVLFVISNRLEKFENAQQLMAKWLWWFFVCPKQCKIVA
jgi:hypothetical protein